MCKRYVAETYWTYKGELGTDKIIRDKINWFRYR